MLSDDLKHREDLNRAKRVLEGDEEQFDAFFNEYFARLYRFALTRLKDDDEAIKDIVQTTMMNAMKSMASYRGEAAMFTWLCQICRNEINAYFRKQARSVPVVDQDDDSIRPILEALAANADQDPDQQLENKRLLLVIQETLDHLPTNYGNALEWKYIEGFSVAEISTRLKVSELAVQSMLARARTAFRDALSQLSPHLLNSVEG